MLGNLAAAPPCRDINNGCTQKHFYLGGHMRVPERPVGPEASAPATCWHNVCILRLVSFARSLRGSQQALFKCHGDVIHLLGLNMDCAPMQGSGFGCSYYNVIAGFQSSDKGPLSLPLHVSWVRLASEFRRSGWEAPLSPQGGREATDGMLLPSLTL